MKAQRTIGLKRFWMVSSMLVMILAFTGRSTDTNYQAGMGVVHLDVVLANEKCDWKPAIYMVSDHAYTKLTDLKPLDRKDPLGTHTENVKAIKRAFIALNLDPSSIEMKEQGDDCLRVYSFSGIINSRSPFNI